MDMGKIVIGSLLKRLSASSCEKKASTNLNRTLACSIVGFSVIQRNWSNWSLNAEGAETSERRER